MNATATAPAAQHMRALAQANRVRLARAELKRQVAEGETSVAEVVLNCPWEAESMTISDLLMSQHRWGRTRCRRFLASLPMSETKTVGTMTDRQRRALAGMLGGDPVYAVAEASWGREPDPACRRRRSGRYVAPPPAPGKPGPRVAISTMWPSGSRR